MRFIGVFFFSLILFFGSQIKAQQTIGAGLGIADAAFSKGELDLPIFLDYSISYKALVLDVKQSFRYWGEAVDVTSNTFLLAGITSQTKDLFRVQLMLGMQYGCSFKSNSKYVNEFTPAFKLAFLYRLNQESRWIVGLEGLLFQYHTTSSDKWGDTMETGGLSLSAILSAKYLLIKKSKTKKEN